MILFIFFAIITAIYGEFMKRDIMYTLKTEGSYFYQLKSSSYSYGNTITFIGETNTQYEYTFIITKHDGTNKNNTQRGGFMIEIKESETFFCVQCVYNFTIIKNESASTITISYTEKLPLKYDVLSDNEDFSVNVTDYQPVYLKYHTPSNEINPVSKVFFQISQSHQSGFYYGYVSTQQFPDPYDSSTYTWKKYYSAEDPTFSIDSSDINFCKDIYCVYYITVSTTMFGSFSILPNSTVQFINISKNEERADVPPMSSSYGMIYLAKSTSEYTNLDISYYYVQPAELSEVVSNVAIFVSTSQLINPTTTKWYAHTDNQRSGFLRISSSDPFFCMDCYYYLRLDGVPDVHFLIDTKIFYSITTDFSPVMLLPEYVYRGYLRGETSSEKVSYFFYVPQDSVDDSIDTIVITLKYDLFVDESIRLLITNNDPDFVNPSCKVKQTWDMKFDETGKGVLYLTRDMDGFCTQAYFIITVTCTSNQKRQINWRIQAFYNHNLIQLKNDETKNGTVIQLTEGVHYVYNATEYDIDSDYIITLINSCSEELYVQISITPFRDGNRSCEWEGVAEPKLLQLVYIDDVDPNYVLSGNYYLNVDMVDKWALIDCDFQINMKNIPPTIHVLNPINEPTKVDFNKKRETYVYSKINVNYINNLQSVKFSLTYSGWYSPRAVYLKTNDYPHPAHKDYIVEAYVYTTPFSIEIKKGMTGFCENCIYYFVVYFPYFYTGSYTLKGDVESLPTLLQYGEEHSDIIESESGADYYTIQLAKNSLKPKLILYLTKIGQKSYDIFAAVSTDPSNPHPDASHADWTDYTYNSDEVILTIDSKNPRYCTGCTYYIAVGPVKVSAGDTNYKVKVNCPDGGCTSCHGHFTIESGCTECESGYYGSNCTACYCGHGTCNDGVKGDGSCKCDEGWSGYGCLSCLSGYYGYNCDKCTVDCHGQGQCSDGTTGTGKCMCYQKQFSSESNCTDCRYGFYDHDCSDLCPGFPQICSNLGDCNSGTKGNGHCKCIQGHYGIDCSATDYTTSCDPHCDPDHGSCDERSGKCICYDQYTGSICNEPPIPPTPSPKPGKIMSGGVIAVIVILVLVLIVGVIGLFFLFKRKKLLSLFSKRSPARFESLGGTGQYHTLD